MPTGVGAGLAEMPSQSAAAISACAPGTDADVSQPGPGIPKHGASSGLISYKTSAEDLS